MTTLARSFGSALPYRESASSAAIFRIERSATGREMRRAIFPCTKDVSPACMPVSTASGMGQPASWAICIT
jgi:hypothetical protein